MAKRRRREGKVDSSDSGGQSAAGQSEEAAESSFKERLSKAAQRKFGELPDEFLGLSVREAIGKNGGTGKTVQKVASHLAGQTVRDVVERAASGDEECETAIKLIKQAKRKSEK